MKKLLLMLAISVVGFACTPGVSPPIESEISTSSYTHGKVVWHDLASPDPESSAQFYETVFGWTTVPYGEGNRQVWIFKNGDQPLALMAKYQTKSGTGEWIGSISVPDVSAAVAKAKSRGAAVLETPTDTENLGTIAFIQDLQGANISFIKFANGDPEAGLAKINSFLGLELWSNNPKESIGFYSDLIGYSTAKMDGMGIDYTMLQMDGKNCASVMQNPVENVRSHWVPYIRVNDVNDVVAKAKAAGATILIEPSPEIRGGTAALFLDPTGAPVAVQVYNP
ncbi:VOC family protein [Algoriphagus namhaensis]|uniref:VOC family protein n=1 Tax=Algoriphagus namhaensis TaxID=915353 RepID=A0ABV8AU49_9BACT